MTDTSKREELIEAAAKAIAQEGRPDWSWDTADQWGHDLAREEAEAALAVFEQAHTPTTDEGFDRWLAPVRAEALDDFAETLRERYPEDVFPRPTDENYHALNVALARANITLDRFSADLMRRAAAQASAEAAAIRAAAAERVHVCDLTDSWFDRTECECGKMHYRCYECGAVVDDCREGGDK